MLNCSDCNVCKVRHESVFNVLTSEEIEGGYLAQSHIKFENGELVFKENQHPSGIYVILEGKIKISKFGFEGKEHIVRFAKQGDIVGYRSLFSKEKYACSAIAITEAELCYIPGDVVFKLIKKSSELATQFMKLLSDDLKYAEDRCLRIAQTPVKERMAQSLVTLKDVYGLERDGATIDISMKRDEIASIAGTSRETATRILSEFADDNLISMNGRKIQILDQKALVKIANQSF